MLSTFHKNPFIPGRVMTSIETEDGLIELSEPSSDDDDDLEYFGELPKQFLLN